MVAINFSMFVPEVKDGSKPHTIRKQRKRPFKICDRLQLYTGMRTKKAKQFGVKGNTQLNAVRVDKIEMYSEAENIEDVDTAPFSIFLNDKELNADQIKELVWNDGFRFAAPDVPDVYEFKRFFFVKEERLIFRGQLVWWKDADKYSY